MPKRMRYLLRNLFHKEAVERALDEELLSSLELLTEEKMREGFSPFDARRQATIELGGVEQVKEQCRDIRAVRWLGDLRQDLHYAVRTLAKSPSFTAVAVIILALGIGANTAVVTAIDAIVFRPLPVRQPDRLVDIAPGVSLPDYLDIKADDQVLSGMAVYMQLPLAAWTPGSESLWGRAVSANFFQVLGLTMAAGRGFLPEEENLAERHPVVVISYRLWRRAYGGDPEVIGKTLTLNREPLTIVGVAPQGFRDMAFAGPYQAVWVPLPMFARIMHIEQLQDWRDALGDRGMVWLSAVGRLRPGVTLEQARARINILCSNLKRDYPQTHSGWNPVVVLENRTRWPQGNALFSSALLFSSAACLLLIGCTNIASLLLARSSTRQKEIATRLALGATRARVVRQLLAEGMVLTGLALVAGLAVCSWTLRFLPLFEGGLGSPIAGGNKLSLDLDPAIDLRVLFLAICIGVLTNLIFGLAPALVASRTELTSALKNQGFLSVVSSGSMWRRSLVVFQVFLSVILLIGAGLFIKTTRHFQSIDPGFDRNVLTLNSNFLSISFDLDQGLAFYRQALQRVRVLPGVRAASWAEDVPLQGFRLQKKIRTEQPNGASDPWSSIDCNSISPGYFKTLGIPILLGRDFTDQENQTSAAVVIVNETMARRYWPGEIPLRKRIRVRDTQGVYEVVGVVKDVKYRTLWEGSMAYAYFPFWRLSYFNLTLLVSTSGDATSFVGPILKECGIANSKVVVDNLRLTSAGVDALLSQERSAAFVLGVFGSLALVLAGAGLYGLTSFSVAQRTREFAIRIALGAQDKDVLRQVILEATGLVLAGLAAGLACSMALSRFITSRLHGISPIDPVTYLAISVLCLATALLAIILPARKATTNSLNTLRSE
jgi:predicted permease